MSKTQKKHISSNAAEDARAFLISGNYKKALNYYKELLKKQPCDEHRNALRDCYLGRVKQLSKSNMNREAVVMWENHFPYCASCDHIYFYITLLLATGQKDKAVSVFLRYQSSLTASQVFEMEEIFAALLLAGNDDFAAHFPPESLIRKHLPFIQQALDALVNHNLQQLELALVPISFRSPYRQLKIILKSYSAQQSGKDSDMIKEFLASVPESSPFYNVIKVIKLMSFSLLDLSRSLSSIDEAEFGLLSGCKGWSADQNNFFDKLRKLPEKANIVALSRLMPECLNHLDRETVKRFYYSIIPFYTPCIKSFEKFFGPMQDQEKAHIRARASAHQSEQLSLEAWSEYEHALSLELQTDDIKLKRALTLRHLFSLIEKTHGPDCGCEKSEESLDMLAKSLELDPLDKETYLKLIYRHQRKGNKKECKKWVDRGLESFLEDRDLLMEGIKMARQHNVLGSALNLTERLLALDPINFFALQNRTELKLEKVKKLVLKRDFEKAEHIIGQLLETIPHHMQWNVQLYHCLSQYIQGRSSELVLFIQRSLEDILAFTRVLLHARQFSLSLEQLEKDIPAIKKIKIAIKDSKQLIEFIHVFDEAHFETGKNETIDQLESVIKKAASYPLTVNEFKMVCAFFTKMHRFDFVKVFLKKQSHLKDEPMFIYYHVSTSVEGKKEPLKESEYNLLIDALEEAEIKKDFPTISLINKLLDDKYIYEEEGDDDPSLKFNKEDVEAAMEIFSELVEKFGSKNKNKKKGLSELINKVLS